MKVSWKDLALCHKTESVVLGILIIFLLSLVFFIPFQEFKRTKFHQDLIDQGIKTTGTIVDKYKETTSSTDGKRSSRSFWFDFIFQADGVDFEERTSVSKKTWETFRVGDTFYLLYLPENPKNNIPEWILLKPHLEMPAFFIAAFIVFIIVVILFFIKKNLDKKIRLLNDGAPTQGTIKRELQHSGKKRRSYYSYTYGFKTRDQDENEGKTGHFKTPEYNTGDTVDILYAPHDPSHNMHVTFGYKKLLESKGMVFPTERH